MTFSPFLNAQAPDVFIDPVTTTLYIIQTLPQQHHLPHLTKLTSLHPVEVDTTW
jgi:hypothetical protein